MCVFIYGAGSCYPASIDASSHHKEGKTYPYAACKKGKPVGKNHVPYHWIAAHYFHGAVRSSASRNALLRKSS